MLRTAPIIMQIAPICQLNLPCNPPIMRARIEAFPGVIIWPGQYREAPMSGAEITRPPIHRITLVQLALLVPLSLFLLAVDKVVAYSVFSGGLVAIVPQAYLAVRAFRWRSVRSAKAIARSSFAAVLGKFLLSVIGFALVFAVLRPINGLAVFVGYLAMLAPQLIGSWLLLKGDQQK
jgi:ATP synthase protein I